MRPKKLSAAARRLIHANENSPLLAAADRGDASAVKALLDAGADVNQRGPLLPPYYGADALTIAALKGHEAVVEVLLQYSPKLDTEYGLGTALSQAISHGHTAIVKRLLDAGARDVAFGPFGALHAGHFDTLQVLARGGIPLARLRSRWKHDLLTHAAELGKPAVECLLDLGLKPTDGGPLHQAILCGHSDAVRALLDAGADPNAPDRIGALPVMAACLNGDLTVLDWLAERGADFTAIDHTGKDCRYWARQSHHTRRVLNWLARHSAPPRRASARRRASTAPRKQLKAKDRPKGRPTARANRSRPPRRNRPPRT